MRYTLNFIELCLCFLITTIAPAQDYLVGESYFGPNNYSEYIHGNLPLIIAAPHGGLLRPDSIPDRECEGCVYQNDSFTQNLIRETTQALYDSTGCHPHIVINHLHRSKLDANRDITEGADENPIAEEAWEAFHGYISTAREIVTATHSRGLFIDLHGHGHDIQRLELGYLLSKTDLQNDDTNLNTESLINKSSIKNLTTQSNENLSDLIRGTNSLGNILTTKGIRSVPSEDEPFPENADSFFSGGYNTVNYGSRNGGTIDAIQIECHRDVRFEEDLRKEFATQLASTLISYMQIHYDNVCQMVAVDKPQSTQTTPYKLTVDPLSHTISITTKFNELKCVLYNMNGQLLKQYNLNKGLHSKSNHDLTSGIYIFQIIHNGHLHTKKIFLN